MAVTFKIVNDFDKLIDDVNQARGIMKAGSLRRPGTHKRFQKFIRDEIQRNARDAFRTQGSSTKDGRWAELTASTLKIKRGRKILRESGRLFRAYTRRRNWITLKQTIRGFIIKLDLKSPNYADFHESGTRNMPARKVLSFTRSQINRLEIVSRAFILKEWLRIPGFLK